MLEKDEEFRPSFSDTLKGYPTQVNEIMEKSKQEMKKMIKMG